MFYRTATIDDIDDIIRIHEQHGHELGFLPYIALIDMVCDNQATVATDAQQIVGIALWGKHVLAQRMRIEAIAVDNAYRRYRVGSHLLHYTIARVLDEFPETKTIKIRCRDDLRSTNFWLANGFHHVGDSGENSRGEMRLVYERSIDEWKSATSYISLTTSTTPDTTSELQETCNTDS